MDRVTLEQLHTTVIRSNKMFSEMTIDGVEVSADLGVTIQVESGQRPHIEIKGARVMYPTEYWIEDVLRYRDDGWLVGPSGQFWSL